jgi:hypothetical protein
MHLQPGILLTADDVTKGTGASTNNTHSHENITKHLKERSSFFDCRVDEHVHLKQVGMALVCTGLKHNKSIKKLDPVSVMDIFYASHG